MTFEVYVLREEPHNGAACWVQQGSRATDSQWHLFRAADGQSWVIDSEVKNGMSIGKMNLDSLA